jgi:hypothetical protein
MNESVQDVHVALQRTVDRGSLLTATGGCLKPEKCFFHLMDFAWTAKGGRQYIAHHEDKSAVVSVPMPDRTMSPITHLAMDQAQKMLGVVMCPSGNSAVGLR